MPGYCKADKRLLGDKIRMRLFIDKDGKGCLLKLPKMDLTGYQLSYLEDTSNLREIVFKPYYGKVYHDHLS